MRAELLAFDDRRWTDVLERLPHDAYHLPEYVAFATRWQAAGDAVAFLASEGDSTFLLPLIVRPVPVEVAGGTSWLDATGPRGYPGPIVRSATGGSGVPFLARANEALLAELRERRIVTAFIRCHPLLSPPPDVLRAHGTVVEHGSSVSIDLSRSEAETWAGYRANHRRSIRRARQSGYRSRLDGAWTRLPEFLVVYDQAMERLGADAQWRLPGPYLADLRGALGHRLHLWVVELDGRLAAAALITEVAGIVEYHLAATAADHVAASPSKLLIDDVSRWARDRGHLVFHLAGSLRHDDALIHFKRGFSSRTHPVTSWRVVSEAAAYQALVARRLELDRAGGSAATLDPDYFPAYRGRG